MSIQQLNELQVLGVLLAANALLASLNVLLLLHKGKVSRKTAREDVRG